MKRVSHGSGQAAAPADKKQSLSSDGELQKLRIMSSVKAITFDLDGTLMHSGNWTTSSAFVFGFVRAYGARIGNRKALTLLKRINRTLRPGLKAEETNEIRVLKIFMEELSLPSLEETSSDAIRTLGALFHKIKRHFRPEKEMRLILDSLPAHIRVALATNPAWARPLVEIRMSFGSVDPSRFEFITTAENSYTLKPDPLYYAGLVQKLDLKADEILHIGNEVENDGNARLVGIKTFILDKKARRLTRIPASGVYLAPLWLGSIDHLKGFLKSELA